MIVEFSKKYSLISLVLIFSCAVKSLPSGGEPDSVAPYIKDISPPNGSINLPLKKSIDLNFNEMLDPNSIKSSIEMFPDIDIKINSYGKKIIIKPKDQWPEDVDFKIKIKRGISDYKGNIIKKGQLLSYSTSSSLSRGFIKGKLFNADSLRVYTVALFEIQDNRLKEYASIEADSKNNFVFNNVKNGQFIIISLMHDIDDIYKDIRIYPYGLSSTKIIVNDKNNYFDNLNIYLSTPNVNEKVVSIDMMNELYGEIELTNSNKLPLISKSQLYDNHGEIDSFVLFDKLLDSIYLSFNIDNLIESYKLEGNFKINSIAIDSIGPDITDSFFDKDEYRLEFSEPILITGVDSPFIGISSQLDSMVLDYYYNNPKSVNLKNINDNFTTIGINSSLILDFNNNKLSSDIVNIKTISKTNKNTGNIYGNISYSGLNDIIVELINIKSKETLRVKAEDNGDFLFQNIESNKYKIWAYEDINTISEYYFNGTLIPLKLSAYFGLYQELIEVRANWDIEGINIIINSENK